MTERHDLFSHAAARAAAYRDAVAGSPVFPFVDLEAVRAGLGSRPDGPTPATEVIDRLAGVVERALVGSTGPGNVVTSPGAAVVEDVAGGWLKELLGLPATDGQGAIDVDDLDRVLASRPGGPTIVCLQAGNVNSGAFATWKTPRRGLMSTAPGSTSTVPSASGWLPAPRPEQGEQDLSPPEVPARIGCGTVRVAGRVPRTRGALPHRHPTPTSNRRQWRLGR